MKQELSEKPEWKGDKNLPEKAEVLKDLSGNEGFKELLKNSLSKQWLLKPEEVAEDGKVTKLYEKINNQVKSLTDALTQSGRADTPLFQAANNVSQNINFMNEVNQTFNYVQIPLQMANGEKAGGKVVRASDGWAWTFADVDKVDATGRTIKYTIEEA